MSQSRRVPPPPTRFGHAPIQPKPADPVGHVPPPPTRFGPQPLQNKAAVAVRAVPAPPPTRYGTASPRTAQPKAAPRRAGVIQRASASAMSDGKDDYPEDPPMGKSLAYYQAAFEHFELSGNGDAADAYEKAIKSITGKAIGQTLGSGESDNYDESYVDIPVGLRPGAPAALWKLVYAGLKPVKAGVLAVACAELGDGQVVVDAVTKCEAGTSKRPPMCHKIAFNHIKYAVTWLHSNKAHPKALGYKGPDCDGLDAATWTKLVWDTDNLQPGHAACNSKTASAAKGNPGALQEVAAINYVSAKLKALQPTWFA